MTAPVTHLAVGKRVSHAEDVDRVQPLIDRLGQITAIVYPQFYGVGGIARYLDSFLANVPVIGERLVVITGPAVGPQRRYAHADIVHVAHPSGRFGLLVWSLRVRRHLKALRREGRLKIVNLHIPPLIPAVIIAGAAPYVLTAHTTYLGMSGGFDEQRHFQSPWSRLSIFLRKSVEKYIFSRASHVICLTEQGRAELDRYGRSERVTILPNGVDLERFPRIAASAKEFDVIFSGRIEIRKGSRPLVDVCRRLVRLRPGIRILIVGYGDDDEHVRSELAHCPDNVRMTGKVPFDEMTGYYAKSRVYVSTSYYEGLPGTCLEAMAMALPVVVWDFLFYRGLVTPAVGIVVRPNDVDGMCTGILALLDAPARACSLGDEGRRVLQNVYDWRALAPRVRAAIDGTPS